MREGYIIKFSASIIRVILAIFCILNFSLVQTISTGYTQSQKASGRTDQIKTMLLRPDGWNVDWSGPRNSGQSEFAFEAHGDKIVVKIKDITADKLSCKRNVTITSNVVRFDDCQNNIITLRFDPTDDVIPFRGRDSAGYEFVLISKKFTE
jgi:hypothetical protein